MRPIIPEPDPRPRKRDADPFSASEAGCGGMSHPHRMGGPSACESPIAWAGLFYYPYSRELWRAFACEKHKDALLYRHRFGTRPEHQAELEDHRRRIASTLAAKHEPIEPIYVYGKPGSRR